MLFRNKECLLLKIKKISVLNYQENERSSKQLRMLKKYCAGQVEWVTGIFLLLFLAIVLCTQFQVDMYRSCALYLEDALAASNLASAVIDLEEYGLSHNIRIAEPMKAFERYCEAVRKNLDLDDNWECSNTHMISGKVDIADYIVYNVKDNQVTAYRIGMDGQQQEWQGMLGSVTAPNGVLIEATSIYSEIKFPIEGFLGLTVEAHKGKLVDIVSNGL